MPVTPSGMSGSTSIIELSNLDSPGGVKTNLALRQVSHCATG
jgi:hypothetical protein